MRNLGFILLAFFTALAVAPPLSAQPESPGGLNLHWKDAAEAAGLSGKEIEWLNQAKILVGRRSFRQIFEPYTGAEFPVFITSDAIINAFNVLFLESFTRLEGINARKLRLTLERIRDQLPSLNELPAGPAETSAQTPPDSDRKRNQNDLIAAATVRARTVIAIALQLLGDTTIDPDPRLASVAGSEVDRIIRAEGVFKPVWLGEPDPGFMALDYSRFKPRGFYTSSESMVRYFRCLSWLQALPFRIDKDEEFLSLLIMAKALAGNGVDERQTLALFQSYKDFLGPPDDLNPADLVQRARHYDRLPDLASALAKERKRIKSRLKHKPGHSPVNDQIALTRETVNKDSEISLRIVSAYQLPESVLFLRTTDPERFTRAWPNGLEICAALGSDFARLKLAALTTSGEAEYLLNVVDESKSLFHSGSLYAKYLNCLAVLLDRPEPDAPKFMSGDPWRIKSCNTTLAGWAQFRHTWALQAKETYWLGALMEIPVGFVEPAPEFFGQMAALAQRAETLFERDGAFESPGPLIARELRTFADLVIENKFTPRWYYILNMFGRSEEEFLATASRSIMFLSVLGDIDWEYPEHREQAGQYAARIRSLADNIENGQFDNDPEYKALIEYGSIHIKPLWRRLGRMCRQLEVLAHKQLRGIPFNEGQNRFIRDFGVNLAGIMLYGGNSYLEPKDDAPLVVDVFTNLPRGGHLHVGIDRPRALYVIYPHKDREIFCRGAVLPYAEFISPSRLTDREWRKLLDSDNRPDRPPWFEGLVRTDGPD